MKRLILIVVSFCFTMLIHGQVSKTAIVTAGGLSAALTPTELSTVTNLTLTGTIDARDFRIMRDTMSVLAVLDLDGVTVAAYSGTEGTIYQNNMNYPANEVPIAAFQNQNTFINTSLTSVIIPSSVTSIGTGAFLGCIRLTSVTIPLSVTTIGSSAFYACPAITSITIPESVTSIGNNVFAQCTGLTSLIIPSSVKTIGNWAFGECTGLTSVVIPSSVTSIGNTAFSGCKGLTSVALPSSITSIGSGFFKGCTSLTSVTIPSSVTSVGVSAFYGCTGLTSVAIPSSVTSIGDNVFAYCSGLTSLTIPYSVTSIGDWAFARCTGLISFYANETSPVDLSSTPNVFTYVDKTTCILHVPYGTSGLYSAADQWKDFTNIVEMPGFRLSSSIVRLPLTKSSATIEITSNTSCTASSDQSWLTVSPASFTGNGTLTVEAIPSVVTRTATVTISSPEKVKQTIEVIQSEFTGILELEITAGGLFSALTADERKNIRRLKITGTIDARDFKTMRDKMPVLLELDLSGAVISDYSGPDGTNSYNHDYFANEVPDYAFDNFLIGIKKSWASIVLPLSVTSIGHNAFYGCGRLRSVTIPSSVTTIKSWAFFSCGGLTSVNMPSSVTSIGESAFCDCTGLTSITIPSSVTSIGLHVFLSCSELTSVYLLGDIPIAFSHTEVLPYNSVFPYATMTKGSLYVPFGTLDIYKTANLWKNFTSIHEMPGFRLSSSNVSFPAIASTASVAIISDVTWTAGSDQSWLTVSPTSFTSNCTLTLDVAANPTVATRNAIVAISSPGVISKTIKVIQTGLLKTSEVTAGGLFSALTSDERSTITMLKIKGTIDARDFKTMRDAMPALTELDISGATIASYYGANGTYPGLKDYPANEVPQEAFWIQVTATGKTSLTSVMLPSSVTYIRNWAFSGCTGLTSLVIPSSVTTIGYEAFQSCTGLTSFTIPSSVTSIFSRAFYNCTGLNSIYASGVIPVDLSSSLDVFLGVNKSSCILHVPYESLSLYSAASQWQDFLKIAEIPVAGSIAASQNICSGIPAPLTSTDAGSGPGSISYRWEYSYNGISWLPTGTSDETYAPGALTQTTSYRRITISTLNGTSWESTPTEPVTVILNNTITLSSAVGTDIQTICGNTTIRNITYTTTGVTGATFSGLPGGITGVWDSNVITISGIPSVSGTFNYTVTLTGGCGTVTKTGSIVVNEFPFIPTALISASQNNICAGTPVTFTAIPVGDEKTPIYKWFINNIAVFTGASGTYIPKNGDEVYAMMTSSNPCATGSIVKSNAIKMVVNQGVADSVFISISQNNVCQGTPVTFKAIPVGGGTTPTYRWFQNKAFVSTGASGTYIPKNGDVIYVEMTSSLACTARNPVISNPISIVVKDKNTASVSIAVEHNNVCAGTPVTLTATSVEGGTTPAYTWFLNNVARATGTTASYVPKNGDVIHAEMTSSQVCVTGNPAKSNIITMVVNQPESESVSINVSRNNVPEGTPVTFTAIPVGGGNSPSFLWYLNNVARVSGVTCSYAPKNGDEIYVVMKSDSPCSSEIPVKSDIVKMNVDCIPAQPASFTQGKASVYQGQLDVRYTVPSVTGVMYNWSYDGTGASITGTSNSVLISFYGTATSGTLSVRASNSCGISEPRSGLITVGTGFKAGFVSDALGNGMKDIQELRNELKVYPNPSSDGPVTFEFRINEEAKAILEIYSTSGMRISRIFEGDAEAGITRTVIYNEPRAPGVYIYTLKWKDQEITGKLIRKK